MATAGQKTRSWDPNKIFDITHEQKRLLEERARARSALKAEWQKKVSNPHRGVHGYIFDPAVQRFLSMRANHWEQFKPTPKSALYSFSLSILPMAVLSYLIYRDQTTREEKFRTGQVAYKDRDWKLI